MKLPHFIARQSRKPQGALGWLVSRIMGAETAAENMTAVGMLDPKEGETVLDIGCGGGVALKEIVARGAAVAVGIDPSATMIRMARRRLSAEIDAGRVTLHRTGIEDLDDLPVEADGAMTVNTIYFWSAIAKPFGAVFGTLKPGGRFVVGFRPGDDPRHQAKYPAPVYRFWTRREVFDGIEDAGFVIERTEEAVVRGSQMVWILARRPSRA